MTGKFAGTVLNMGCKLAEIFQTIQGWCVAMCVFVANFFAGYEGAINAVIVCVVLDTVWGNCRADQTRAFCALRARTAWNAVQTRTICLGDRRVHPDRADGGDRVANRSSDDMHPDLSGRTLVDGWFGPDRKPENAVPANIPRSARRRSSSQNECFRRRGEAIFGRNERGFII